MNFFGLKNKKTNTTTPSSQFTSGTEAVVSTRPLPPPASAFGSHQTSTFELAAAVPSPITKSASYDQTMQELSDFQIDSDDSSDNHDDAGFDDVEFGNTLVTNATAHMQREQRDKRKTATIWTIAGVVIVGLCVVVGLLVATVAFSSSSNGGNNNNQHDTTATSTTQSSFDSLPPTVPPTMLIDNATFFLNETIPLIGNNETSLFVNMTDIILDEP